MKKTFFMLSFFSWPFFSCQAPHRHLEVGDKIPIFSLKDQNGDMFNIQEHIGKKKLVIYFYPKDESSVCTKEACGFKDQYATFEETEALVIGINSGSVESHKKFQTHYKLPFTLLSDPDNRVLKMFGVKNKFVFTGRETFIIDLYGRIVFIFNSFTDGGKHADEAIKYIKSNF